MAVKNSITKQASAKNTLMQYVDQMVKGGAIQKALPSVMTPERFTRITLSAISNNKELQNCTPITFVAAMMQAAQLGLEPNTPLGQAYLIPYRNHGVLECQYQTGYQGMLDLAYRTKQYKHIGAEVVYANDEFDYELGLDPKLTHKPAKSNRGEPVFYYACYTLLNGGQSFVVMSKDDMVEYKNKFSKATSAMSPWNTNFDSMAKKTVLKQLLKYAPKSADMAHAISADESVKSGIDQDMSTVAADNIDIIEADATEINSGTSGVNAETGEVKTENQEESESLI